MIQGARFQLRTPTFGLGSKDGATRPVLIPDGSVVEILSVTEDRQRMVEVRWHDVNLMMFIQDIQDRGELLNQPQAKGSEA